MVVLASVAIAATALALSTRLESFHDVGGMIGTIVSAVFLLAIAVMNLFILRLGLPHVPPRAQRRRRTSRRISTR